MHATLPHPVAASHRLFSEIDRLPMAKADLRKSEITIGLALLGRIVSRTKALSGLSLKEFASAVRRDERQCARWMDATERAQVDAILECDGLRAPFLQAFGELTGAEVEITIRVKRPA